MLIAGLAIGPGRTGMIEDVLAVRCISTLGLAFQELFMKYVLVIIS